MGDLFRENQFFGAFLKRSCFPQALHKGGKVDKILEVFLDFLHGK